MEKIKKGYNFKIISLLIMFIFGFEAMCYASLDAEYNKTILRVPIGIKKERIQAEGYVKEGQVKAFMAEIKRIAGKEILYNTALQILNTRELTPKALDQIFQNLRIQLRGGHHQQIIKAVERIRASGSELRQGRDLSLFDPADARFSIEAVEQWFIREFLANILGWYRRVEAGKLNREQLSEQIQKHLNAKLGVSFELSGLEALDRKITIDELEEIWDRILEEVLLPRHLAVMNPERTDLLNVGWVIGEQLMHTSPGGRQVPEYIVQTRRGSFGNGFAVKRRIFMPREQIQNLKLFKASMDEAYRAHKAGKLPVPSFQPSGNLSINAYNVQQFFIELARIVRGRWYDRHQNPLRLPELFMETLRLEELCHVDFFDTIHEKTGHWIEASLAGDEELRAVASMVKPGSQLASVIEQARAEPNLRERLVKQRSLAGAIIELEPRVKILIETADEDRVLTFLTMFGNINTLPLEYWWMRDLFMCFMGAVLFNHPIGPFLGTTREGMRINWANWTAYIKEEVSTPEKELAFARKLKEAASTIYEREFESSLLAPGILHGIDRTRNGL